MDRRVKYTKKVIEETFLTLLQEKDISSITVTEICKIADINRATFYRYYLDTYDLLKKIEGNFIDELKNSHPIEELKGHSVYSFTKEVLNIFINNKKLVKILFNTNHNIYFLNEVLEVAYSKCYDLWSNKFPDSDLEEIEYSIIFIFNGALGIINYWIKNDFNEDIEVVSKQIENLSLFGARKYITK